MSRAKTAARAAEEASAEAGVVDANTAEGEIGRGSGGGSAHTSAEGESATEGAKAGATETDAAETDPAEAEVTPAAEGEAADPEAAEAEAFPAKTRAAWRRLPALLLAVAVVLTGAGVWFTLEARSAADNPAAGNLALTDVGATADVSSAVSLAVNRIFSYSYDRTDVTEKAAAAVLRGSAKNSYDKLFAEVRRKAPEQKLVLTSRVSAVAVQELKNGHARLLVFLDQSAVRADNNVTDSAAAQLSVTAEHTTGGWVITELEPR